MKSLLRAYLAFLGGARSLQFLAPLALRLYLAPIMIIAGANKLAHIESIGYWFDGLGIPMPGAMAWVAALTELAGGMLLLAGLATRLVCLPLMFAMVIAAATVHWERGWHVLPEASITMPWEWRQDLIDRGQQRKQEIAEILRQHGDYGHLTEAGSVTVLKNGIEFAATYFIMLLALFYLGGGRWISVDYWLERWLGGRLSA